MEAMTQRITISLLAWSTLLAVCLFSFPSAAVSAAEPSFYAGKTIRIVVYAAPGGGYDLYARVLARHMGRHIPGNPSFLVQNMPGGGGIIAQNYLYNVAKRDGLTIGHLNRGIPLQQIARFSGIQFDTLKFNWIGSANQEDKVAVARHDMPFKTLRDVINSPKPLVVGGVGPGSDNDVFARALQVALNANLKLISGYGSTSLIRAAMERGEVEGMVGWSWSSVKATAPHYLEEKFVNILADVSPKRSSELQEMGVPWVFDLPMSNDSRAILETAVSIASLGRPFAAPPDVPPQRVKILREAFAKTMKDPQFVSEADRAKLEIQPLTGDEVQQLIERIFSFSPAVLERVRDVLK